MSRSSRFFVATMLSSRSADRGGARNQRRSFSDGSHDGRRGQFVTGDSHLRSVRDYNLVHRQGSFSEQPLQQPPPPPLNPRYRCPPPPFYQNQQSRYPPPPFYKNQHSRYPPPPFYQNQHSRYPRPSFNQNQALGTRRPKPLDYRTWEYAKVPPPPNSERFVILSYNLLADYLAIGHRGKLYYHIPRQILDWEWRKRSIIFELGLWSADIMCFQEVDKFQDLESELRLRGYSGIWKMRTGNAIDGCAIFWRTSRFKLLYEESIEYSKLGLRDNVAQICVLEMLGQNFNKNGPPLSTSSAGSSKVVVCNIHVLYNPKRGEIKLGQVRTLLDRAHAVSKIWSDAPVLLCGDFNFTPKSPLYNFISEQKLDLSGVDRDKVSGQASAQIHSWKPHNPNPRVQLADGSTEAPPVVGEGEVDIKLSDPLTVMQKNSKYGNAEIIPFMDNSSPSQSTDALSNLSDKACSHWQSMNKESTLSDVAAIETEQTVVDGFNESSSCLHSEGQFPTDKYHCNDEIHKFSHYRMSHLEDKSDLTEIGDKEKANASLHSNHEPPREYSDSDIITESDKSCDKSKLPLVGNDHSSLVECSPEVMNASNSEILYLSSIDVNQDSCSTSYESDISDALAVDSLVSVELENLSVRNLDEVANKLENLSVRTPDEAADKLENLSVRTPDEAADKLENLSMKNLDEAEVESGTEDEDDNIFLSELHNNVDAFTSTSDQFVGSTLGASSKELGDEVHNMSPPTLGSEVVNVENITYDPSLWTPMEIATATGNEDCTFLEHPLQLKSTYTEVEDCTGTRDSKGEPLVTSYNRCFMGTVDYIWHSNGIQTVKVLAPIPKHAMQWTPGFPTKKWGSDHIALASEVAIVKD
ncbi:carbon catabolite repressor protein 4 homolog 6 isoform X2 [Mangifera indica]|uniref:carbon catabolite repressor protein 4 homolog 6 isoform X2 n=1 Tax=Mangifera indica TaxID=29780 RepID=UPI001CFC2062|nr:carbon catabolite repressor protein 4 homolog 6 isoform X2 [Mangifera indica]